MEKLLLWILIGINLYVIAYFLFIISHCPCGIGIYERIHNLRYIRCFHTLLLYSILYYVYTVCCTHRWSHRYWMHVILWRALSTTRFITRTVNLRVGRLRRISMNGCSTGQLDRRSSSSLLDLVKSSYFEVSSPNARQSMPPTVVHRVVLNSKHRPSLEWH